MNFSYLHISPFSAVESNDLKGVSYQIFEVFVHGKVGTPCKKNNFDKILTTTNIHWYRGLFRISDLVVLLFLLIIEWKLSKAEQS